MSHRGFSLEDVSYAAPHALILRGVSLNVSPGQWISLLGPNGAGKSTLLRILAAVLPASSGTVLLDGRALSQWPARERAQRLAFVSQHFDLTFPFRVREVVAMGRTPYLRRWQQEGDEDWRLVEQAMALTEIVPLADRDITTLSGGELQRVALARALAQRPQFLLLDEPTASLDLRHQFDILEVLAGLVRRGVTILTALHDLNLAASYCSAVVLLRAGEVYAVGPPDTTLTPELVRAVFDVEALRSTHPVTGALHIIPLRATTHLATSGVKGGHTGTSDSGAELPGAIGTTSAGVR